MKSHRNTFLEVNLNNLSYNFNFFKEKSQKTVFTVVKANAYGNGLIEISKYLSKLDSQYLATATLDEALEIRAANITTPILVMGYTPITSVQVAVDHNITLTIISLAWAQALKNSETTKLKLHLKLNFSMNRLGLDNLKEASAAISLLANDQLIEGIYTHYCCSDSNTVKADFKHFKHIVKELKYDFKWIHASNSFNALMFEENFTNAIRVGIGLYGGYEHLGLKNIASLKTEVSLIRYLERNEAVSYDGLYLAKEKTKIAILPIGYADGVWRMDIGNQVYINDRYYEIIGSICMDQLMVKVDDKVNLYDEVEIFGENIDPKLIATSRNTIIYEVFTSISNRVKRRYIK